MVLFTLLQNRVVLFPTSEPHGRLSIYLLQSLVVHSFLQSCMVSSFSPITLWSSLLFEAAWSLSYFRATWSLLPFRATWSLLPFRATWSLFLPMAAGPRFKSQRPASFAAPFLTPPTVSYTCQHPCILPAFLGCHSKSGQVWPHGMEPIISTLSRRPCNQGELLPSPILGGIWSHPPGSKHGHSYLTHP